MIATVKKQNSKLQNAKNEKNDEFYTQLKDIENELKYFRDQFKDKVVYCNCDDPRVSNFFHYFSYNFELLGLKRLIATCYKNNNMDLFSKNEDEKAVYLIYEGAKNGSKLPTTDEITVNELNGDGDFRSQECINLLKQADIVVTNPPYSLFREYISQLVEYKKQFLVIGNSNASTYKEMFSLIQENKMWLGHNCVRWFQTPSGELYEAARSFWYTNLPHNKRNEEVLLFKTYKPENYPEYDNYYAIEVAKVKDIPMDYDGVMGVPITFLDKYNPNQFEIVASDYQIKQGLAPEVIKENWSGKYDRAYLNGKRKFSRILIKRK